MPDELTNDQRRERFLARTSRALIELGYPPGNYMYQYAMDSMRAFIAETVR